MSLGGDKKVIILIKSSWVFFPPHTKGRPRCIMNYINIYSQLFPLPFNTATQPTQTYAMSLCISNVNQGRRRLCNNGVFMVCFNGIFRLWVMLVWKQHIPQGGFMGYSLLSDACREDLVWKGSWIVLTQPLLRKWITSASFYAEPFVITIYSDSVYSFCESRFEVDECILWKNRRALRFVLIGLHLDS